MNNREKDEDIIMDNTSAKKEKNFEEKEVNNIEVINEDLDNEKYIQMLMEKSTPDLPMWNIENIRKGKKAKWNYIDGCMIKAIIEMYHITGEEK